MTRPEDTWSPVRHERSTTVRFGSITAAGAGVADVVTVTGTTLKGVPIYGPTTVGLRVLLLHDGQKLVGISDTGPALAALDREDTRHGTDH
jgi:hypothetical protein